MSLRLPHAPFSARKRKAPGMVKEIHGVLISNKRVHLWGPRFADVGVHHNLRTMFADMAPIQVDSSDEEAAPRRSTLPASSALAQEAIGSVGRRAADKDGSGWTVSHEHRPHGQSLDGSAGNVGSCAVGARPQRRRPQRDVPLRPPLT